VNRRLLLIGGSSGSGKSTTAKQLSQALGAGWLQVDTLWVTAQLVLPKDSEAYRLLRVDERTIMTLDPIADLLEQQIACSRYICSWLPRLLEVELQVHPTLVVDGAWLLPEFAHALHLDGVDVRAAYLHEEDLAALRSTLDARRFVQKEATWHGRAAENAWVTGNYLAAEAERLGLPVVPARPRETLLERVRAALNV